MLFWIPCPFSFQIGTSVAEYAAQRKKHCEQHNITWQPQVLILGRDVLHIEQAFVFVNDMVYPITSTVKAVDICFKIFQVFGMEYPVECRMPWLCLQKAVYNIETVYDKPSPRVLEITSNIKKTYPFQYHLHLIQCIGSIFSWHRTQV